MSSHGIFLEPLQLSFGSCFCFFFLFTFFFFPSAFSCPFCTDMEAWEWAGGGPAVPLRDLKRCRISEKKRRLVAVNAHEHFESVWERRRARISVKHSASWLASPPGIVSSRFLLNVAQLDFGNWKLLWTTSTQPVNTDFRSFVDYPGIWFGLLRHLTRDSHQQVRFHSSTCSLSGVGV